MKKLLLLISLLPLVATADYHGEVEGFTLKEEHIVEACIASFNIINDPEANYWMENYLVDLEAIAIYETVLKYLIEKGSVTRFDVEQAVADCKRARADEQGK